jgi:ABC-type Na+ efflux pump permease subunit
LEALFKSAGANVLQMGTIKDDKVKKIVVVDKTQLYKDVLKNNESYIFEFSDATVDELKSRNENESEFTALLYITKDLAVDSTAAVMYSDKQVNMELKTYVSGLLNKYIEEQKLASYNIPHLKEMVEKSSTDIDLKTIKWGEDGKEKEASAELAIVIGMITAFIIYMFIVIYGAQVMSGVVQEKTNRIVEVMISSVKPFELMMGKIIGIAMVGLTQFEWFYGRNHYFYNSVRFFLHYATHNLRAINNNEHINYKSCDHSNHNRQFGRRFFFFSILTPFYCFQINIGARFFNHFLQMRDIVRRKLLFFDIFIQQA